MLKFWTRRASPAPALPPMTGLTHAAFVEVVYDPNSKRLWINTENGCVARIYNIGNFHFRQSPERNHETPEHLPKDDGRARLVTLREHD